MTQMREHIEDMVRREVRQVDRYIDLDRWASEWLVKQELLAAVLINSCPKQDGKTRTHVIVEVKHRSTLMLPEKAKWDKENKTFVYSDKAGVYKPTNLIRCNCRLPPQAEGWMANFFNEQEISEAEEKDMILDRTIMFRPEDVERTGMVVPGVTPEKGKITPPKVNKRWGLIQL